MKKVFKYLLIGIGVVVLVLAAIAVFIAATFDPNDYKPRVIDLVKEKTGRTLALPGDIALAFFPKLGAKIGKASLSEQGSDKAFASVDSVRVSLAVLPLLHKELVVDEIAIAGLRAGIVKRKDGSMNIDDLLKQEEKKEEQPSELKFDIDHISLEDSAVTYRDEAAGKTYALQKINLDTGRVALGTAVPIDLSLNAEASEPKLNLDITLKTKLTFDPIKKQYAAEDLALNARGAALDISDLNFELRGDAEAQPDAKTFALADFSVKASGKQAGANIDIKLDAPRIALADNKLRGEKITATAKLVDAQRTVNAALALPGIEGSAQSFQTGPLQLDIDAKLAEGFVKAKLNAPLAGKLDEKTLMPKMLSSNQLAIAFDGKFGDNAMQGKLTSPLILDLDAQQLSLDKLSTDVTVSGPKLPNQRVATTLNGSTRVDLKKEAVQAIVAGKLDLSQLKAKLGMIGFAKPAYTFDVDIDQLNADAYLGDANAKPAGASAAKPAAASAKPAPGGETAKAAEPLDFSALKDLNASGSLRIGALTFSNIKSSNIRLDLKAKDGNVNISPLSANLYQGSLNGSVALDAAVTAPRIGLKQKLTGVAIGPLLRDLNGSDSLEGKGNVALDVTAQGTTVDAMKRNLNGTMAADLFNGAIKGINIAARLREAKATIAAFRGDAAPAAAGDAQKTDFSELHAAFVIKNGIAHNEDLSAKSPLLRLGGAGDINIPEQTLNYLAKATVVATSKGQGGAGLDQLKGITVPVRITGPFEQPQYKLDLSNLASEAAKQKIDEKKEELKARATEKLEKQLGDKLPGGLKGLFGK